MKHRRLAILGFLALGVLKLPLEQRVMTTLRAEDVLTPPVDLGLRENLGQMSFAASLGGLRSLIASVTYLQAFAAWEDVDWGKVDSLMSVTTRLQPKFDVYWDDAASYMGLDAASYYRYNESRPTLYRNQLYRQHVQRGIDILEQGLRVLPGSHRLYERLGMFYAERIEPPDHLRAGQAWLAAYRNGALDVYERRAAYEWAQIDSDPRALRASYRILMRWYEKQYRTDSLRNLIFGRIDLRTGAIRAPVPLPSVVTTIKTLEHKLNMPPWQRIPDKIPASSR